MTSAPDSSRARLTDNTTLLQHSPPAPTPFRDWHKGMFSKIRLYRYISVKVIYNYFTLYNVSSLNLKIIWSKRVSFFVFLRCSKFIPWSYGSRLSVIVRNDAICFYWNEWMKNHHFFFYIEIMSSDIQNQLLQLILKSRHKPIKKMGLQRDRNCSYWKGEKKQQKQQLA